MKSSLKNRIYKIRLEYGLFSMNRRDITDMFLIFCLTSVIWLLLLIMTMPNIISLSFNQIIFSSLISLFFVTISIFWPLCVIFYHGNHG
jgi:hypothetical protein